MTTCINGNGNENEGRQCSIKARASLISVMTEEQIEALRFLIKEEIESAGIDGMEHGAWGWAEKQLDKSWGEFRKSFEGQ